MRPVGLVCIPARRCCCLRQRLHMQVAERPLASRAAVRSALRGGERAAGGCGCAAGVLVATGGDVALGARSEAVGVPRSGDCRGRQLYRAGRSSLGQRRGGERRQPRALSTRGLRSDRSTRTSGEWKCGRAETCERLEQRRPLETSAGVARGLDCRSPGRQRQGR